MNPRGWWKQIFLIMIACLNALNSFVFERGIYENS